MAVFEPGPAGLLSTLGGVSVSFPARSHALTGMLVAAVLLAGACGQSTSNTTSGGSAVDLTYAQSQITKYQAQPSFVAPGPAFDATKAHGKLIFNIPFSSGTVFNDVV